VCSRLVSRGLGLVVSRLVYSSRVHRGGIIEGYWENTDNKTENALKSLIISIDKAVSVAFFNIRLKDWQTFSVAILIFFGTLVIFGMDTTFPSS